MTISPLKLCFCDPDNISQKEKSEKTTYELKINIFILKLYKNDNKRFEVSSFSLS